MFKPIQYLGETAGQLPDGFNIGIHVDLVSAFGHRDEARIPELFEVAGDGELKGLARIQLADWLNSK